jgi:hypothetical protein
MRSVSEYMQGALEFEELAAKATDPELRRKYTELATSYWQLAADRERLIQEGVIASDESSNRNPK